MKTKRLSMLAGGALASLLVFGMQASTVSAQGRGGGHGGGGGMGNSGGGRVGTGTGGVDRGIGTASDRSGGRSDTGRATASDNSGGRSDRGTDHARAGRNNGNGDNDASGTDNSSRRLTGLARKLNTDPATLQAQYNAALSANPDLKFGQFVAANVLASNLGATNPNVTTAAVLSGLQNGTSIGQTLQNLGVSKSDAKKAEKQAKRAMRERADRDRDDR